ncbi:hypothetical protein HPB50_006782 [Hyalomma asiaticum]|uniref:Uncharacterized protein n=1 Tax=Hyalomma asiaticum TaxID=266040 RepID=A0ACB7SU13_HYAAI|nr:hypothetical protein HPB50_006782 [Hyalomma asiaticum]
MRIPESAATIALALCALSIASAAGKAAHKLHRNVTDTFELFAHFPYVVLEYTSGDDPEFQCLTNKRVQLDMEKKTSTYVWMFKGHGGSEKKDVTLNLRAGDSPDKVIFTLDNDQDNSYMAHFVYTDYDSCVIVEIPYDGDQCQLWVAAEYKYNIPQHCLEQLEDICDVSKAVYEEELCKNDKDDL